jgi:hypothetical protein
MPHVDIYFKKAESNVENIVEACSGRYVHVEMIPSDHEFMYTSYMFETFTQNNIIAHDPHIYTLLRISLSEEEHSSTVDMLLRLTDRSIPYNYSDLPWCVVPSITALKDIKNEEEITALFCSQAIILVLRLNVDSSRDIYQALMDLNSRTTSPTMLFEKLKQYGEII